MTTLSLPQLTQPATAASWNDYLLATATKLGLPASDWEAGAPTRTTFAVFSNALMIEDVDASLIAQAGFIDYAAFGSVTYTNTDGNTVTVLVTPDPSIPSQNPTGALGALDVLADAVYDVQRILKTNAAGTLAILNTSASTFTYQAGTYHVAQPSAAGTPAYSNSAAITIAPSTLVGTVSACADNGSGKILITASVAHGLTTGAIVALSNVGGVPSLVGVTAWAVTVVNSTQFTLDGSTFAGAWTGTGNIHTPTLASFVADNAGSASTAAANTVTQAVTSIIGLSVANPTAWTGQDTESNTNLAARCRLKLSALATTGPAGAYKFFALSATEYAPKLTPARTMSLPVTSAVAHLDKTTSTYTITIANANGGVSGNTYPTGSDDNLDVWTVGLVEQAYAAPMRATFIVQGAANASVAVVMQIWSPTASTTTGQSQIKSIATAAISAYFRTIPPGGITDPGGATNVLPIEGVRNAVQLALSAASITVQDLTCTLNGSAANVSLATYPSVPQVPIVSGTPTVTATGV